ncbi:MAG: cobyric acid synthase [Euryarchaeota archaeon]|nr:cobyric acid synthase [Euryarchaeota archaeon]
MIQGTASFAGKTTIVAGLCRIFANIGYSVAPFKAQNMSLNSFVTKDGGEIAYAQASQAQAAGIEPIVEMNPILLKPKGDQVSQVIVKGKVLRDFSAKQYYQKFSDQAIKVIKSSFDYLSKKFEIIIIEGAGNPAEININDFSNMKIAELTNTPVILVADIDRGGVFASIVGTLQLLSKKDKERIKGIIINKFRGDLKLLQPGLKKLEKITKIPVIGVLQYDPKLKLPEEDSVALERKPVRRKRIHIAVAKLKCIANFTDIEPLNYEPDTSVEISENLDHADAIIIPGSKNSIEDSLYLQKIGLAEKIIKNAKEKIPIFGICGGYQILGKKIIDNFGIESKKVKSANGLGLLNIKTSFEGFQAKKIVSRIKVKITGNSPILNSIKGQTIEGYEIHAGVTSLGKTVKPFAKVIAGTGNNFNSNFDGAIDQSGLIFGTYVHGIFNNLVFRQAFLNYLRARKNLPLVQRDHFANTREKNFERIANLILTNINLKTIHKVMGLT